MAGIAENALGELTVSELVRGWDDVQLLLGLADLDQVSEAVSTWPRPRLATALVAAVTVVRPDEALAGQHQRDETDHAASGQRTPGSEGGQESGHVAGTLWPR